jgi:hypothetical protein
MKLKTGSYLKGGLLKPLLGLSTRNPLNTDSAGLKLRDSSLWQSFVDLPKAFIRHTAGSHSDDILNTQDAAMQHVLTSIMPALPDSVGHDFTWPAQLPIEDLTDWVTERTGRITLLNEPPNRIPSLYANGAAAVEIQKAIYAAHPDLQSKMWIQTGKPEVVRYPEQSTTGTVAKHEDCLAATQAAVTLGLLPARIVTTHKLLDAYPSDRLAFYRQLMADYVTYFGANVEVCFQEFNYADEDTESVTGMLMAAEFLLILARLKGEGYNISGAAYHQGFAVGTSPIFGLNAPSGQGSWVTGLMYEMWTMLGGKLDDGQLMLTTVTDQPDRCQVVIVRSGWRRFALYSNIGSAQTVNLDGVTLEYVNSTGTKTGTWTGSLPANSCGVVRLRRRLVK